MALSPRLTMMQTREDACSMHILPPKRTKPHQTLSYRALAVPLYYPSTRRPRKFYARKGYSSHNFQIFVLTLRACAS